jgi:hypothetical protein
MDLPEIKFAKKPTLELLKDIVITAVEGGIGYWASCTKYKWEGLDFPEVTLAPDGEPTEFTVTTVTPELVCTGLQKCVDAPAYIANGRASRIMQALVEDDASYLDRDDADCIIQMGMFGAIVYG